MRERIGGESAAAPERSQEQHALPRHRQNMLLFFDQNNGTFHETAKVVNSLFGETWRIVEFGSTNCQLEFERCQNLCPGT